jgi:magnesium transporter
VSWPSSASHVFYFRDVYDHLIGLAEAYESHRDIVAGTLELYLSTVNNDLSVIVKRLTGVTVILAGIAAVSGLFGMSQATPALAGQEGLGFYAVLLLSVVAAIVLVWALRRIGWL